MKTEIIKQAEETIERANSILISMNKQPIPSPEFRFSFRRARQTGLAGCKIMTENGKRVIKDTFLKFNIRTAEANREDFLNQTVGHEVAHLMGYVLGSDGHDYIWRDCCRKLGVTPLVYAPYVLEGYHQYTCKCGSNFNMTEKMHRRMQAGEIRVCTKCNSDIFQRPIDKPV